MRCGTMAGVTCFLEVPFLLEVKGQEGTTPTEPLLHAKCFHILMNPHNSRAMGLDLSEPGGQTSPAEL